MLVPAWESPKLRTRGLWQPVARRDEVSQLTTSASNCLGDSRPSALNGFQLCFRSLFHSGRGFAFPCDERGLVDMISMSDKARTNYLFARAMVGRDLCSPAVEAVAVA
jgi:hypothetical protein